MITPLVSIIVPVYNTSKFIDKCIDSLLDQTYGNIEIILVDDGSTDGSGEICDGYCKADKRVRVIHKINGGLASSRKIGIESMTGQYAVIVDSDDWLDKDTIEECVHATEKYDTECVFFSYIREYESQSLPVHIMDGSMLFAGDDVKTIYRRLWGLYGTEMSHPEKGDSLVSCCMKLYSATILQKAFFVDTKLVGGSEDALFNIYALRNCHSVYYLDKPFYHYRKQEEGTLSSTYRPKLIEQYKYLYSLFDEAKDELQIDEECTQAYINRTALTIIGIGLNELGNPICFKRIKRIREYIRSKRCREAYKNMQYEYMPFVWKVFFLFVKGGMAFMTFLALSAIKFLKSRV